MEELSREEELDLSVEWQTVKDLAKGSEPSAWALAVLEAEKIFRETLLLASFGENLREMIKNAQNLLGDLSGLLEARELQRKIVHEVGFLPEKETITRALEAYFQAILDLTSSDQPVGPFSQRLRNVLFLRFGRFLRYLRAALILAILFFVLIWFLADTSGGQRTVRFLVELTDWALARIGFLILGLGGVFFVIVLSFIFFDRHLRR